MEVDLVRVRKSDEPLSEEDLRDELAPAGNFAFKLPAPPSPFKGLLGETEAVGAGGGADSIDS